MSGTQNFSVGRDVQAVLIAPNGTRIDLTQLTDFDHTAEYKTATSSSLTAPKQERYLPDGHKLKFDANEALFASIEAGWWAAGSADPGTSPAGSAFVYITETDGSQSTYQFRGLSLKFTGIGNVKSESAIKQTIDGHAMYWDMV
jgi:hypothetical protein